MGELVQPPEPKSLWERLKDPLAVGTLVLSYVVVFLISVFGLDVEPQVLAAPFGLSLVAVLLIWLIWRVHVVAKIVASAVVVLTSVILALMLYRSSEPTFKVSTLDSLQGDENAYELTDMLIQADEEDWLVDLGVGITFTLQIRPQYTGKQDFGKVIAILVGERGQPVLEKDLWDPFTSESRTTTIVLSLEDILRVSGLQRNDSLPNSYDRSGQVQFQEARIELQIVAVDNKAHPWHIEQLTIRNAPWSLQTAPVWRDDRWEVDVHVRNLGAPGEFTVIYHLARLDQPIEPGDDHPMHSGTTDVAYWNAPKPLHRLGTDEGLNQTISVTHQMTVPGRYLLDVYPIKKQEYTDFSDEDWEDVEEGKELWLFADPYQRLAFVVTEPGFPLDPTIQTEWERLRNDEGIDLGVPITLTERIASVHPDGSPRIEGLRQQYQRGEIYAYDGQGYALYGPIFEHYQELREHGYSLAFPNSSIQAITSTFGTRGTMVTFEDDAWLAAIYASEKGVAAVGGWIGDRYLLNEGGHSGWLGFPLAEEADYPDSTIQQFEGGYLVYYFPYVGGERYWGHPPTAYPYLTSRGRSDFGTLFEVQADQLWQDTGVEVEEGDRVTIMQVSGNWTYVASEEGTVDANGDVGWDEVPEDIRNDLALPSAFVGTLVGRIGGEDGDKFPVGRWSEFTSLHDGTLYLAMNDNEYEDNVGLITVQITVEPAE